MYKLTSEGIEECRRFIAECEAKLKEILDAGKDTASETDIPTVETIESDINAFGVDEDGDYFNGWCVTDNHNSDYPIRLSLGVHLIELEDTNPTLPTSGSKAVPDEHTKTAELLTKHTPDFHIQYILQDLEVIEKILARNTLSQSDVFAQGLRYCECIRQRLHIMDSAFDTE